MEKIQKEFSVCEDEEWTIQLNCPTDDSLN